MRESVCNRILTLILVIFIAGLYIGIAVPIIVVAVIFFLLFRTSKQTAGFYLLMYGGVIGGTIRSLYPFIPLYGLVLCCVGLYLVKDTIIQVFLKKSSAIFAIILVLTVLGISYAMGPRTEFCTTKMVKILQNGVFFFFAYFTLSNSESFRVKDLVLLLLFTSVFLMSYAENMYLVAPSSILDFNWFRQGLTAYEYYSTDEVIVSYQEVGMDAAYALALLVSLKRQPKDFWILLLIAIFITLASGARQSLLACFAVIFLRYAYFNSAKSAKKVFSVFFACALVFFMFNILSSSNIEVVNSTLESGDEARNLIWLLSLKLFSDNPIFGIGLGGFADYSLENPWPHNFILEILCECGLFGLVCFILIVAIYFMKHRIRIKYITPTGMFYFLTLCPMLVRYMVSGDFRLSIAVFCSIFAAASLNSYNQRRI